MKPTSKGENPRVSRTNNDMALAMAVREGGDFDNRVLQVELGLSRGQLARSYDALANIGAITVTPAPRGRPRIDEAFVRSVTPHPEHWLWSLLVSFGEVA